MLQIWTETHSEFRIEDLISHDVNIIDYNDNIKVRRDIGDPLDMPKLSKIK
jgi:hypothetical protein